MRYLDLRDYLDSAATATGLDVATLQLRHVDAVAAMLALAAGGGPESGDPVRDTARGAHRLISGLIWFRPPLTLPNDRVTLQAAKDYSRNRGWQLDLGADAMQLIDAVETNRLDNGDVERALTQGLRPSPSTKRQYGPGLRGLRLAISRPVTEPSPRLQRDIVRLEAVLKRELSRREVQVLAPFPRHRSTASGHTVQLDAPQGERYQTTSTREIMRGSIVRVSSADGLVTLADPSSSGVPVEREWALRLRTPVIEVSFTDRVHPHGDGPARIHKVAADPQSPERTARRIVSTIERLDCELRDSRARGRSLDLKNAAALQQFRAKWKNLTSVQKDHHSATLGMSRAYLEGLQANGRSLELASDEQRRGIELALGLPNPRILAYPAAASDSEIRLLSEAGVRLGLVGVVLVTAVQTAITFWRRAHQMAHIETAEEAERSIRRALIVLRGGG